MTENKRRIRNLIVWSALGFLIAGWIGAMVAFIIYIALDDRKNKEEEAELGDH